MKRDKIQSFIVVTTLSVAILGAMNSHANQEISFEALDSEFALLEDCLSFDASALMVQLSGEKWLITNGRSRVATFQDRAEAEQALEVIQHYNLSNHCFIGRPKPSMVYWLVQDVTSQEIKLAPEGKMENEDCLSFDANNLSLIPEGDEWLMLDGQKRMKKFPNQVEAEQALGVIQSYGFTHTCYVGRPGPSFVYLRK